MLEEDYLMKIILGFAAAISKALETAGKGDTKLARYQLDEAIGAAADMDPEVLLSLAPESVANILILGSLNDSVAEYIVHALMLEADYFEQDGYTEAAALRREQAVAITEAFSFPYEENRLPTLLEAGREED